MTEVLRRLTILAALAIDSVISVGDEAAQIAAEAWRGGVAKVTKAQEIAEAVKVLREYVHAGDLVLVKGSRSAKMERIVEALAEEGESR